jgi:hypothetical protein
MNLSYRKSFADAPPVGPDQAASSYMGIKIAAQRRAIPSPQGRGLGEGKETVDRPLGISLHIHAGSSSFCHGTPFSQVLGNQWPNSQVHGEGKEAVD